MSELEKDVEAVSRLIAERDQLKLDRDRWKALAEDWDQWAQDTSVSVKSILSPEHRKRRMELYSREAELNK